MQQRALGSTGLKAVAFEGGSGATLASSGTALPYERLPGGGCELRGQAMALVRRGDDWSGEIVLSGRTLDGGLAIAPVRPERAVPLRQQRRLSGAWRRKQQDEPAALFDAGL